ncbi:MAG: NAD(P)H-hydrate dehydratase [Oscillospiraceae bacterium]|nr:NAD(P)H-hydrate dehydratase [Oscillospiraceae bacterium]
MEILTVAQMREMEEKTARVSSYAAMMATAGKSAARYMIHHHMADGGRCVVLCGKGNNGGDGYVAGRELAKAGMQVQFIRLGVPVSAEARQAAEEAAAMRLPVLDYDPDDPAMLASISGADMVIDAVFGTGFHGGLPETFVSLHRVLKECRMIFAMDMPSGINADTGCCAPFALRADVTFAFGGLKAAHILKPAALNCGEVVSMPIGIPEDVRASCSFNWHLTDQRDVLERLCRRPATAHKGMFGRLLAVCGSRRYRGAALLAVSAALRCGPGLVTLASPEEVLGPVICAAPECIAFPLKTDEAGCPSQMNAAALLKEADAASTLLLGCGVGVSKDAQALCRTLIGAAKCQLVLDADALTAVSGRPALLREAVMPPILTPHLGEMARLCGKSIEEVAADRPSAALEFARTYQCIVVLKDSSTVVAAPQGELYFSAVGNPGLAKGGSGDVLAGIVAGLCAQGMPPDAAAACGVWLHGHAADRCALRRGETAMLPHEILEDLCAFLAENQR